MATHAQNLAPSSANGRRPALGAAATHRGNGEEPPLALRCALRALGGSTVRSLELLADARLHQPTRNRNRRVRFADETSATVYRETLVDREQVAQPAVLVVAFRLRIGAHWLSHAAFRWESVLNTVLFAGFPGFVSKLWFRADEKGVYRGLYQWDGAADAVAYVRALWWVLSLVAERASIHYAVLPGLERDAVLALPALLERLDAAPGGWWRPIGERP